MAVPVAYRDRPLRRIGASVLLAFVVHVVLIVVGWQLARMFFFDEVNAVAHAASNVTAQIGWTRPNPQRAVDVQLFGGAAEPDASVTADFRSSSWETPFVTALTVDPQHPWRPALVTPWPASPARRP